MAVRLTEAGIELQGKARTVPVAIGQAMGLTAEQDTAAKELLRLITANVAMGHSVRRTGDSGRPA